MKSIRYDTLVFICVLTVLFAPLPYARAREQANPQCHPAPVEPNKPPAGSMRLSVPDVLLVDQDGRRVRFRSEVIAGKTVAINFIFTTCSTICPPMGANFAALQKLLGEQAGRAVQLVSISIDPVTDTPDRLKAWQRKFNAGPGWTLLTGAKQDVDTLLTALDVFTPGKSQHSPVVLIGNEAEGSWTRAFGLAPPSKLAELIKETALPRTR